MKKIISFIIATGMLHISWGQSQNIVFTVKQHPANAAAIQVYAKNMAATVISGKLGDGNLTICVAFPAAKTGRPAISSPIAGQSFDPFNFREVIGTDSIYAWNGSGATAVINFL